MNIDLDSVPSTVESAVDAVISSLTDEEKQYIHNQPSESIHFSAGMHIRNSWSLWEQDTPLKETLSLNMVLLILMILVD